MRRMVRKITPVSARVFIARTLGLTGWYRLGDHITFREEGFVAASSPANLLARHNAELDAIHSLLKNTSFESGLEIGCGFGRLSPVLASHVDRLVSVDVNASALQMARRYYPANKFIEASATQLPFADEEYDLVCTWTVLQHIAPDQLSKATSEISRVLAANGTLLLCEETKYPDTHTHSQSHTWHRTVEFYRAAFHPLVLEHDGWIESLESLPEIGSPGRVMVFRKPNSDPSQVVFGGSSD